MKFLIAFVGMIAVASAVPAIPYAVPAAVTYQSQKSSLIPIGTTVQTSVSKGAPVIAAPIAAPIVAPIAAPIIQAPLPIALSPAASLGYGYGKMLDGPSWGPGYGAPALAAPVVSVAAAPSWGYGAPALDLDAAPLGKGAPILGLGAPAIGLGHGY